MTRSEKILQTWLQAVNNGDIEKLKFLYGEKAILIPTFSNKLLDTPEKILDYFLQLSSRENLKVTLHEKTVRTQAISDRFNAISGIYKWQFLVEDEQLSFEARFSYMLDLDSERPIIHHHSSQIPRVI